MVATNDFLYYGRKANDQKARNVETRELRIDTFLSNGAESLLERFLR